MARIQLAWVDASETVFGPEHIRNDERVASLDCEHEEQGFAFLSVVIKNPRIGPLHATRKQWAWLSVGATPLFFGRVKALPNDINKAAVTFEFLARPANYQALKEAVAATKRDLPAYDEVWFTPEARANPDTVLEARAEFWHINRVTHAVTTSHILTGEDGLQEFMPHEIPADSIEIHIGQVPARTLRVMADVTWGQAASGSINLGVYQIRTMTGKSLIDQWPKTGANLEGGWFVSFGNARDNFNIEGTDTISYSVSWSNEASQHSNGDTLSNSIRSTRVSLQGGDPIEIPLTSRTVSGEGGASSNSTALIVPEYSVTALLALGYNTTRARKETIAFTMSANFQDLITAPDESDVTYLVLSGTDVGVPLSDLSVPIGDVRNRSYFSTERGRRSLEWVILRGSAQLMLAGRAVEVTCVIPWSRAIALSCRMNGRIHSPDLPGGVAEGKIIRYGFSSSGDEAKRIGFVTIACSVGYAGTVVAVPGSPDYCDDDYVQPDYQYHTGQTVVLTTGTASSIGYSPPAFSSSVDDGLHFPLSRGQGVLDASIIGSLALQRSFVESLAEVPDVVGLGGSNLDEALASIAQRGEKVPKQLDDGLKNIAHYLNLRLKNLNAGPFDTITEVTLTQLELPMGIDLAAGPT